MNNSFERRELPAYPKPDLGRLAAALLFGGVIAGLILLFRHEAPGARPVEAHHKWSDSFGLPYKPRGLF